MNAKFKGFTDEINELKLDNFNMREALKSANVKLGAKEERIQELEEQLRKARSGQPQVSAMQIEDQQSETTIMENTERSSAAVSPEKKKTASKQPAAASLKNESSKKQLAN